jgi:hypothetical protein
MALVDRNGNAVRDGSGNAIGTRTSSGNNNNNNSSSGDGRAANRARSVANLEAAKAASARDAAATEAQRRSQDKQSQIKAAEVAQQQAIQAENKAIYDRAAEFSGQTTGIQSKPQGTTPPLANALDAKYNNSYKTYNQNRIDAANDTGFKSKLNDFVKNSAIVKVLDKLTGAENDHPGMTRYQYENQGPAGRYADTARENAPWYDQMFTYQNTAEEQQAKEDDAAKQRAILYRNGGGGIPMYNSKGEIVGYADSDDSRIYNNESRRDPYSGKSLDNNGPDGVNGNMVGVSAPLSGSYVNNGFNGQGYAGGGTYGNYFSAIPDGIFNSGGSPPLMNIQTSYGNTYNGADQWTASGNATRAAQAAATTGES